MLADFHVVRDLDEIINLRALADDGRAERAAVNRHVRADLHVIADDDVANLRNFAVDAAVQHVAESVRADDRAGVDADAMADFRARINCHVRKQIHVVAELRIVADKIAALQNRVRANLHALAHGAMRPDVRRRINFRGFGDDRRRMNSGGEFRFREKQRERLGEGDAGVRHANQDFFCGRKPFLGDDGGGGALLGAGEIILVFGKGQVAGLRTFGGREAVQDGVASPTTSP